jgi:hypothetical protein
MQTTGAAGNFWLLGTKPCGADTCLVVERSTDGGKTFQRVGAPSFPYRANQPGEHGFGGTFRFVNARDGYLNTDDIPPLR